MRGAAETKAGNAAGMPYARDGVFVAARTRIDRNTGTAAANALHFSEMVAPEACFRLRLLLDPRDPRQADSAA